MDLFPNSSCGVGDCLQAFSCQLGISSPGCDVLPCPSNTNISVLPQSHETNLSYVVTAHVACSSSHCSRHSRRAFCICRGIPRNAPVASAERQHAPARLHVFPACLHRVQSIFLFAGQDLYNSSPSLPLVFTVPVAKRLLQASAPSARPC